MSQELISHSPDLQKLVKQGYSVLIVSGHLLIEQVPYVAMDKEIRYGSLVSTLETSNDRTVPPKDHKVWFIGEPPHKSDGSRYDEIINNTNEHVLGENLVANVMFSTKPKPHLYTDYYQKMVTHINLISSQAEKIDSNVTARINKPPLSAETSRVLAYSDTNSTRAEIYIFSQKLRGYKVGIVGCGGTGSYILDYLSKTEIAAIHLFDDDDFSQHNAFRCPGAASSERFESKVKKVHYLKEIYSRMHLNIIDHPENIDPNNLQLLDGLDFVFICIDDGDIKKRLFEHLITKPISFIDTGIGTTKNDSGLLSMIRTTTGSANNCEHLHRRVDYGTSKDDGYNTNIQICELNALNAAMAVMKWKKMIGFYQDTKLEYHSIYTTSGNFIINDETKS